MQRFLNSLVPLFQNSQERLRDIDVWTGISNEDEFVLKGWSFFDAIKCKEPVIEKEIEGMIVKYSRATKRIFVPDLIDMTFNSICGIRNTLEYGGE